MVFTAAGNEPKLAGWATDGCEVIPLPTGYAGLSVDAVLAELGRRRMTHVLVEGGAAIHGAFLDARAADEFHVFVAPKLSGGAAALTPVGGNGVAHMAEALTLTDFTATPSGEDIYLHGFAPSGPRANP